MDGLSMRAHNKLFFSLWNEWYNTWYSPTFDLLRVFLDAVKVYRIKRKRIKKVISICSWI